MDLGCECRYNYIIRPCNRFLDETNQERKINTKLILISGGRPSVEKGDGWNVGEKRLMENDFLARLKGRIDPLDSRW